MYCIGIFGLNIINAETFLMSYPLDAVIPENIYYKIILDTNIYGENLKDKIDYIDLWRVGKKKNGRRKSVLHKYAKSLNPLWFSFILQTYVYIVI